MFECITIPIGASAAGANETVHAVWPYLGTWRVKEIYFAPDTTLAANDTNYATVAIDINDGAGGSFGTDIVSFTTQVTGGYSLTIGTAHDCAPSGGTNMELQQGYILRVSKTYAASGGAVDGLFTVVAEKLD